MLKLDTAAVLTINDEPVIRITAAGDAVLEANGEVMDLIEAREIWAEIGDEDEFDRAVAYVNSLR